MAHSATRRRAVLAAIDRIDVWVDRISNTSQPASAQRAARCPCYTTAVRDRRRNPNPIHSGYGARRAGREIRMLIDGTDPFVAAKPLCATDQAAGPAAGLTRPRRYRRRSLCCACQAGRREPVLFHSGSSASDAHHQSDPRRASAMRSTAEAARALTSAARLARSADRARFCLTRSELKDLPHIKPEKGPTSLRSAWHRRHLITGGGAEYGPTEDYRPSAPLLPAALCVSADRAARPGWTPRKTVASRPRKANSRERQASGPPHSPLEGDGFEPSVPLQKHQTPTSPPIAISGAQIRRENGENAELAPSA